MPSAFCLLHYAFCLAVSLITGMAYPLSVALSPGDPVGSASRNYAADLFGAAIGAFLVPVVFLPLAGLTTTLFLLSGLNLIAGVFFLTTKNIKFDTKVH